MIQIRFIVGGANSLIGGFLSGDKAQVSKEFGRHLVEEARVAEYVNPPAAVDANKPPKTKPRKAAPKE